jgi:transcription termination factor Rho
MRGPPSEGSPSYADDAGLPYAAPGMPEPAPPPPAEGVPFEPPSLEALYTMGVLDMTRDGHGFLRNPATGYVPSVDDAYVAPQLIRQYGMRDGCVVDGEVGPPKRPGQNPQLLVPRSICGVAPHLYHKTAKWDDLVVIDPEEQIDLSKGTDDVTLRIMDMLCPIGFGQRGLLVSPPRAGKTTILQKIAQAVQRNYPDRAYLCVLLTDERPEEATAMRRATTGEVAVSTNDRPPENHVRVVEMVLKKAKRLVEVGRDVVIVMDSLTRLGRAYNLLQKGGGRTLSGGMDSRTLEKPKAFFGAARKVEDGGSLTILATALIDTGSRMDQVIFEEFKGTGNMEVVLDREMAELRIWPAIDVNKSGTRKEEKLLRPSDLESIYVLRRVLNKIAPAQAMESMIPRLAATRTNAEFLASLKARKAEITGRE